MARYRNNLPQIERSQPEVSRLQPDPEVENIGMQIVMEHERSRGCQVYNIRKKNLGCHITSLYLNSGELRLVEVKGIGAATGTVLLTPNERRVAEDRQDCYWLYVVTSCKSQLCLQEPIKNPARFPWHEVRKVEHYYLSVDALTQPMSVRESPASYGRES
ncbi:MAG TPA: DUF3883 domain-containing protein [Candidatus Binatia bacterium]